MEELSIDETFTVLIADDDYEDRMLIRDAFSENRFRSDLRFVEDGEEVTNYLLRRDDYENPIDSPRPSLLILDLNMPKKDGCETLSFLRGHPEFRSIPVVVFTTSNAGEEVDRAYSLGANSFLTKPVSYTELCNMVNQLVQYWFQMVVLPDSKREQDDGKIDPASTDY